VVSAPGRSSGAHRPKLLVLTGTIEETIAAVSCGAQAVGLVGRFGSHTEPGGQADPDSCCEMIRRATHYCRVRGVQVYGILNSPANTDAAYAEFSAEAALYRSGAECAVVNCLGALGAARRVFPDWPIWAGWGLAAHNTDSVAALEQAGVSGVILPPELTAGEISEIAARTSVQLGALVHQELCTFYAGHCVSPGSLTRGAGVGGCDNWCRRGYTLEVGEASAPSSGRRRPAKRRLLSLKALEALPVLRELVGAGLSCLVVDGAFRGPEHVAVVTGVYSAAMDRLSRAPGSFAAKASEMSLLAAVFSAELSTGYYERGQRASIGSPEWSGGPEDRIVRTVDADTAARARARIAAGPRRVPVYMQATARVGDLFRLEISDGEGHTVSVCGSVAAEAARTAPLSCEYLHRQLSRLGETPFALENLQCELDGSAIVPVSDVSDVRRRAARALEILRAAPREQTICDGASVSWTLAAGLPTGRLEVAARVSSVETAIAVTEAGAGLVCIGGEAFVPRSPAGISGIEDAVSAAHTAGAKLYYATSRIVHDRELNAAREGLRRAADVGADGFLVANLGLMSLSAQLTPGSVVADWSLGIASPFGWPVLSAMGAVGSIIQPCLDWEQVRFLAEQLGPGIGEVFAFGRVELGVSEYCVVGGVMGGRSGRRACSAPCMRGPFLLRDSLGRTYPVRCDRSCRMHLFDWDELNLIGQLPELSRTGIGRVWLDLRGEPASRATDVCREYVRAAHGVFGGLCP
jgi:collagenase-like PrtC family protease